MSIEETEDTDALLNKFHYLMKKGKDFSISIIATSHFLIFYLNKI
jgi:hypothetical protein